MMPSNIGHVARSRLVRRLFFFTLVVIVLSLGTRYLFLQSQQRLHQVDTVQQNIVLLSHLINTALARPRAQMVNDPALKMLLDGYAQSSPQAQLIVFGTQGQTVMINDRPELQGQTAQLPIWQADRQASAVFSNHGLVVWQPLDFGLWLYVQQPLPDKPTPISFWVHAMAFPILLSLLYLIALMIPLAMFFGRLRQLVHFGQSIDDQSRHQVFAAKGQANELTSLNHALNRLSYRYHRKNDQIAKLRQFQTVLVDASPEVLIRTDQHGLINFVTSSFEHGTGMAREQILGQPIAHIFTPLAPAPADGLSMLHRLTQHVRMVVRLSGRDRLYDLWLNPIRDQHGQLMAYGGVLHDVTHYHTDLGELRASRDSVQARLTENERMLATMSHELRTPLNGILGMAQLLRETQLDQEQNEYARTLYNSGQAMLRLVNDILDLSKLDAGKMQTEQLDFDLLELSIEVCDLMAASAAQKSLELVSFIDPDSPRFLQGDPYRIRQILLNLINNAIKFTSTGYVALHVRPIAADDPVIVALGPLLRQDDDADVDVSHADLHAAHERAPLQEVDAPVDHQWVMFEVSDSGVGIAPENQQALFQFFAQADRTVSRRFGGTGLGLAISRGLAEAMNGCITLSSEPNQGTVFRVYLPLVKQSEVPMYHRPILLANLAVEVFEPLDLNRQGLSRLFQSLSIHAEMHDDLSGLAIAAERTSSQHPILLIDYELLDDRPLADYLSRYPELRQAHCILLSRRSRRSIPARMIEGFEGFVFKPLRVEHLLAELLRMLDGDDQALDEPPQENQQALMDAFFAQVKQTPTTAMQTGQLSLRVLLAEDNIVNQKVASKMLQKLGCEVTVVEDGQQAVDFLMGNQPVDLVLMDCRMPNMDGLEATRLVRRQMNSIPIIALTANDTDEDREACMNAGMDDFLAKPLDQSVLSNLIARFRLLRQ